MYHMAKADFYDSDPNYNYSKYWENRDYENKAEEQAIKKMLRGKKVNSAVDIGGGYGRLCPLLQQFSNKVYLLEPSKKQREIAKDFLANYSVSIKNGSSTKTDFSPNSVDLITMIRVMHHLPDPEPTYKEIHRILKPGGLFLLEVANSKNFKSVIRRTLKGKRTPSKPVDIKNNSTTLSDPKNPFVNHNPHTVINSLHDHGFKLAKKLSVSNLRSTTIKKVVHPKALDLMESSSQYILAPLYFGPSIFFLFVKESE